MTGPGVRADGRRAPARQRSRTAVPVLVMAAWAALFMNTLTFYGIPMLIPIPPLLGRLVTQGAMPLALVLALAANPRVVLRRNLFLGLLTVLALIGLLTSLNSEFMFGSMYRALRLFGFVLVLWLLTPWWGRADMLLLRCHLRCLWFVLGTVVVGVLVDPGDAFAFNGRLSGVLWPIPATQVAHYAAVAVGVSTVLWLCRELSGRRALLAVTLTLPLLALTHTRTALVAMGVGTALAAASLFLGHVRVRRTSAVGVALGVVVLAAFANELTTWALRGQSSDDVTELTGRTKVWSAVFAEERSWLERVFGSGLSNQSYGGLSIDSDWVAAYVDQGWLGVTIHVLLVLVLLLMAAVHERGPQRAVALFLVVYELLASITESTLVSPSPYLLELIVAASLLARQPSSRPG